MAVANLALVKGLFNALEFFLKFVIEQYYCTFS